MGGVCGRQGEWEDRECDLKEGQECEAAEWWWVGRCEKQSSWPVVGVVKQWCTVCTSDALGHTRSKHDVRCRTLVLKTVRSYTIEHAQSVYRTTRKRPEPRTVPPPGTSTSPSSTCAFLAPPAPPRPYYATPSLFTIGTTLAGFMSTSFASASSKPKLRIWPALGASSRGCASSALRYAAWSARVLAA